jgi:hypothetical protein
VPVHHLDKIARDTDSGRIRTEHERLALVAQIVESSRWVTEGIHVGWTDELCRQAEVIVWLDHVGWPTALMRVMRRFVEGGLRETRRRRGLGRIVRPRSYARHIVELYRASREIRAFKEVSLDQPAGDGGSRAATVQQLKPYAGKVAHCRSGEDIESLAGRLAQLVARSSVAQA